MFYGRLRFYCIFIVYAKFFMFTLFLLYLVRNDNNKDDQSINQSKLCATKALFLGLELRFQWSLLGRQSCCILLLLLLLWDPRCDICGDIYG